MTNLPQPKLIASGDYSYGIYLYHWPLLQLLVSLFPGIDTVALAVISLPVVYVFAAASWHWVEKPVLRFKAKRAQQAPEPESFARNFAVSLGIASYAALIVVWTGFFSTANISIRGNAPLIALCILLPAILVAAPWEKFVQLVRSKR